MAKTINGKVRVIEKPKYVQIALWSGQGPLLNVTHANGSCSNHRISNAIAEVLIANGMSYEG